MEKIYFIVVAIVLLGCFYFSIKVRRPGELDKYIQEKYPKNIEITSIDTSSVLKFVITKNESANLFAWVYNKEKNFTEVKWGTNKNFYVLHVGEYCKVQSLDERGCVLVASDSRKMKVSILYRSEIDLPDNLKIPDKF